MKKAVIKCVYLLVVFITALFVVGSIVNHGNTDMTMEMGPASFPVIKMKSGDNQINELHGYVVPMESAYQRDSITPLAEGRRTGFVVEKYGQEITGISFEVRSIDGTRLVENTKINIFEEDETQIRADFTIKDLIEEGQEYMLVLLLELEQGNVLRYYTRIIDTLNYHVEEKINYVLDFHQKTFNKEQAKELTKYLESNAKGDNTTLTKVTINSSLNQVTWGDLAVEKKTTPMLTIKELGEQTGSFEISYIAAISEGKIEKRYRIKEFYRIRYTADRIYLLDYERTMEQILEEAEDVFVNNKIALGIHGKEKITLLESDGGNVFAFTDGSRLYCYNDSDNKMARLFSFYDGDYTDERDTWRKHGIQILNVDEAGNVKFIVYGYMNRGRREGNLGIAVYQYSGPLNTVEEMAFIPCDTSYELLKADLDKLAYMNKLGIFIFMNHGAIYAVDLGTLESEQMVTDLKEGGYQTSDSNRTVVWQTGEDLYRNNSLILMDLNTQTQTKIEGNTDEYIMPLGFMGEDLIYGLTKQTDVTRDSMGSIFFPMYKIIIQNSEGEILKSYEETNLYTVSSTIEENQINLKRVQKDSESGIYASADDYQIVNTMPESDSSNTVEEVVTDKYQKIVQIAAKTKIDSKGIKLLTPKEVLFEGGREIALEEDDTPKSHYYVYGKYGVEGSYTDAGDAVNLAYDISGVVINDSGSYVFARGNRSVKNQIMAIKGSGVTEEKNSLAVCLDTILQFEGVMRNTEQMLEAGDSAIDILSDNIEDVQVLDLTGCSLDAMLYYVNQDIPVLASLQDGSAMLIIGFNELNTVVMDPLSSAEEKVYKKGMNDSKELFEGNGNRFTAYIRVEK